MLNFVTNAKGAQDAQNASVSTPTQPTAQAAAPAVPTTTPPPMAPTVPLPTAPNAGAALAPEYVKPEPTADVRQRLDPYRYGNGKTRAEMTQDEIDEVTLTDQWSALRSELSERAGRLEARPADWPTNWSTGKPFGLWNALLLGPGEWATNAAIKACGGRLREGARGVRVLKPWADYDRATKTRGALHFASEVLYEVSTEAEGLAPRRTGLGYPTPEECGADAARCRAVCQKISSCADGLASKVANESYERITSLQTELAASLPTGIPFQTDFTPKARGQRRGSGSALSASPAPSAQEATPRRQRVGGAVTAEAARRAAVRMIEKVMGVTTVVAEAVVAQHYKL